MRVIGDRESRFRVNGRPTNSDVAQQIYGLIHDLSAIPPTRSALGGLLRIFREESPTREGRAGGMANRIFPRLPCRRRFESMPAAATSKTRYSRGR